MVILPLDIINYIFLFKQPHPSALLIKDFINTTKNNNNNFMRIMLFYQTFILKILIEWKA